ncbi:MAG: hypothetical protein B6I29_01700 [Marinitoga sp. 4572_148]|nr:MAG: hypothetical protein B6I29_01700 [Marinitoga sp. 4572_148]
MKEYWYFLPLIGVIAILMAFQISEYNIRDYAEIPDEIKSLEDIEEINIEGINISLKFDPKTTNIYYSNKISIRKEKNKLYLNGQKLNGNLEIVIGTKDIFNNLTINGVNISLSGKVKSDILKLDGSNITIKKDFIFIGNEIDLDGVNNVISGEIQAKLINIDGISNDINLKVMKVENINLDGISINGEIMYLDTWEGIREISLDGISTKIVVKIKKENIGEIKINKNVEIIKY